MIYNTLERIYPYRFGLFLLSLSFIIFGGLLIPFDFFEDVFLPIVNVINVIAGMVLIMRNKRMFRFFTVLLVLLVIASLLNYFGLGEGRYNYLVTMLVLFPFYSMVTYEIIRQILTMEKVNSSTLMGLISGYLCLGLSGALLCLCIEMFLPGSFSGISSSPGVLPNVDDILYYSYITLLTIGYGEIVPVTDVARKAAILIGLIGQFYMVIITAVVVTKYMNQKN